jgi:hypothetical protein
MSLPTTGRIVHYTSADPVPMDLPAIVIDANSDGNCVNLVVFNHAGGTMPVLGCREGPDAGMWHWPERV